MPIKRSKKNEDEDEDEEIMIQGEEYNGDDEEDEDEDEDENSKDNKGASLNKNVIIIVAVGLVVVGIIAFVATSMLKNKKKAVEGTEGAASKYENFVDDTSSDTSEIDKVLAEEGLLNDTTSNVETGFTETDKSSLRGAGYTGPEIEQFEKEGKLVNDLLLKAKVEKDRFLQERYKELDTEARKTEASDAYKALRDYTWLSGNPQELLYDETESYSTEIEKYNARYEKIPLRGNFCLIKLYMDEDKGYSPVFYNVHPERYSKLKDSGNMVITYDVVTYNGAKYICNVSEVTID